MNALNLAERRIADAAREAYARDIERGAACYDRQRDLPKLLGPKCLTLSDSEILEALDSATVAAGKALVADRWHSDLNRSTALRQAYAAESKRVRDLLPSDVEPA